MEASKDNPETILPCSQRTSISPNLNISQCQPANDTAQTKAHLAQTLAVNGELESPIRRKFDFLGENGLLFEEMRIPNRAESENHAVYGTLMREPGHLEELRIYCRLYHDPSNQTTPLPIPSSNHVESLDERRSIHGTEPTVNKTSAEIPLVVAVVRLGPKLDGHEGIVHGGVTALLVDDVLGFAYEAIPVEMAMTANLNLNFRRPLLPSKRSIVGKSLRSASVKVDPHKNGCLARIASARSRP